MYKKKCSGLKLLSLDLYLCALRILSILGMGITQIIDNFIIVHKINLVVTF